MVSNVPMGNGLPHGFNVCTDEARKAFCDKIEKDTIKYTQLPKTEQILTDTVENNAKNTKKTGIFKKAANWISKTWKSGAKGKGKVVAIGAAIVAGVGLTASLLKNKKTVPAQETPPTNVYA